MRSVASNRYWSLILIASTAACVGEIEPVEDDLGDGDTTEGTDDGDGSLAGDADSIPQWGSEAPEVDGLAEIDEVDTELIAASSARAWKITIWYGSGTSSADFGDGNAPDLYVKRFCGGAYRNKTPIVWNSTFALWNFTTLSATTTDAYIKSCYLELWDADANEHDFGGRWYIASSVDTMIRNGWARMQTRHSFTVNDDIIVWIKLERL